jgi:hypothetical protein
MKIVNIGDRIAFITKTNADTAKCYFLGYGKYLGKMIPTKEEIDLITNKKKHKIAKNVIDPVCKFLLDDGSIVWQWDGWFISEERFIKVFIEDEYNENWEAINVDIHGKRK